jgi:hypothetical protein
MTIKKTSVKKEDKSSKAVAQKERPISLATNSLKSSISKVTKVKGIGSLLPTIFYVIWILIGLFLLWFIYANYRLGAFDSLIRKPSAASAQGQSQQAQAPTETTIPGIGKVNIECVQTSLSQDSIMKIVQEKSDKSLSDDDKKKLSSCVVGSDSSAATTPTPSK